MIQIDMKMPEYCDDCPMLDEYGDYPMCRITQETRGYNFNARKKRMDKCPMKPVEAVPLNKLCGWLASIPMMNCRVCKETVGFCDGKTNNICGSAEQWKAILIKWMEGLDAAD